MRNASSLEKQATVVELPGELRRPWLFKAFPRFFDPKGVIVIIDSDMIVTRSLNYVIDKAVRGKICVFPDHFSQRLAGSRSGRWGSSWRLRFGGSPTSMPDSSRYPPSTGRVPIVLLGSVRACAS